MYRADALAAAAGVSEDALIERAGRAVAEEVVRRFGARKTVVLVGPGNNGKDGRVVARYLASWGWPVSISDELTGAALIIDAMYGAGLNRDFPAETAARVRAAGVPVISIDVPSGLDGLTGQPRGACIQADLTVTFFRKKPAHLLYPGRSFCGEVVVADIGIPSSVLNEVVPRLYENSRPHMRPPPPETHKFKRGHAIIWSGPPLATGAARLAALAAARSGAGLVSIAGPAAALEVHSAHVTSIMLKPVSSASDLRVLLDDGRVTAVCIGPAAGVTDATRKTVLRVLRCGAAVVLDADALTAFADEPSVLFQAIGARSAPTALTPHEGEFQRLFGATVQDSDNKVARARDAARVSGATVLYKGPDTVIAHPDGRTVINGNGTPKLAVAGSGDVLAGVITGLLALGTEVFEAACAGAWLHADAADRSVRPIAEDLIAAL
jgi:ADP-dependent NAD(P)H-hydrate dehydratase / NAD(P)H-hydrate epimerase